MRYVLALVAGCFLASCGAPSYPINVRQCAFNSDMNCQLTNALQGYVGSNQLFGALGSGTLGQDGKDVYQKIGFTFDPTAGLSFQYVSPGGPPQGLNAILGVRENAQGSPMLQLGIGGNDPFNRDDPFNRNDPFNEMLEDDPFYIPLSP